MESASHLMPSQLDATQANFGGIAKGYMSCRLKLGRGDLYGNIQGLGGGPVRKYTGTLVQGSYREDAGCTIYGNATRNNEEPTGEMEAGIFMEV